MEGARAEGWPGQQRRARAPGHGARSTIGGRAWIVLHRDLHGHRTCLIGATGCVDRLVSPHTVLPVLGIAAKDQPRRTERDVLLRSAAVVGSHLERRRP